MLALASVPKLNNFHGDDAHIIGIFFFERGNLVIDHHHMQNFLVECSSMSSKDLAPCSLFLTVTIFYTSRKEQA